MRKIWIDCDPGIDDAMMLAAAKASEDILDIIGISSVAGNQTTQIVTPNILGLASLFRIDAPVVRGAIEPLIQPMDPWLGHGPTGLGNVVLPKTDKKLASENGVIYMYETIMSQKEKVTLVATGPLTNMALLLKLFPDVKEKIVEMVIMGGGSVIGNASATAEFNMYTDPEAAKIVFHSGVPVTVCSLDITNYCGIDQENVKKLKNSEQLIQNLLGEMLDYFLEQNEANTNNILNLHDVCTIIYLTNPEVYEGMSTVVDVDCNQGANRGATLCDKREYRDLSKCNANWLTKVDQKAWLDVVLEKLWAL